MFRVPTKMMKTKVTWSFADTPKLNTISEEAPDAR